MFEKIREFFRKWFGNKNKNSQKYHQQNLPNKTQQELKDVIARWDFSKKANAQSKQRIDIEIISLEEEKLLRKDFKFKTEKSLRREIDSHQIIHTLKRHGANGENNDANVPIDLNTILDYYPSITKDYDVRKTTTNNKIIYAKQINGHFIVFEEVLSKQNKIRYFDAWQTRGKLNEQELFKNVAPNADKSASPSHHKSGEPQKALGAFDGYFNNTTKKQTSQEKLENLLNNFGDINKQSKSSLKNNSLGSYDEVPSKSQQEQESNINTTTQTPSVDGADIDTNTGPKGPRR